MPAILEYIPYRKRDGTRARDEPMHGWFAAHGYAAHSRRHARLGRIGRACWPTNICSRELDDACEVIAWISRQPWCSGRVGMMGKSWGGFNALQMAALRPPALKAIITVCSTDDRYADDIHYMGGALLNDNLWWGTIMLAYQARPPDPGARRRGLARRNGLRGSNSLPFFPALWLAHQRRDAYWRHGSVCEDFSAIACPVFAVGGWADAYTNAVPRLLEGLTVPRLGLIGPWAHIYPQDGMPGPAIGFLQEALRWWDHWLKGEDRGIMAEPMLRAFIEEWSPPGHREPAPGRFVGEDRVAIASHRAAPTPSQPPARLDAAPARNGTRSRSLRPAGPGIAVGEWMGTGVAGEEPADQRHRRWLLAASSTASRSTSASSSSARRRSSSSSPRTSPSRSSARGSATSRRTARPGASPTACSTSPIATAMPSRAPLVPGRFYRIRLKLNDCGYAFDDGPSCSAWRSRPPIGR